MSDQAGEARAIYLALTSFLSFHRDLQIPRGAADREELIARAVELLKQCRKEGDGRVRAPSPWHAWVWLWHRTRVARQGGRSFFFRGQTCSSFRAVMPRLNRPTLTDEDARRARVATRILSVMVHENEIMGSLAGEDPEIIGRAFAQHYGIKTSLL